MFSFVVLTDMTACAAAFGAWDVSDLYESAESLQSHPSRKGHVVLFSRHFITQTTISSHLISRHHRLQSL